MYAGTDGFGPLIPTIPSGGHVWVSTNVAGGATTWVDQTGAINPDAFPISSIALDTSDAAGLTAYVSIMGFHVSHVWKTSDGGVSWTDFTANLPDAPANTVLVDPGSTPFNGMVYVGTDVGVFSSSTAAANWTEVGPAPNSGNPGFLPNVAVTALHMSTNGSAKLLRASTYGRGLWQFPVTPTFVPTVAGHSPDRLHQPVAGAILRHCPLLWIHRFRQPELPTSAAAEHYLLGPTRQRDAGVSFVHDHCQRTRRHQRIHD